MPVLRTLAAALLLGGVCLAAPATGVAPRHPLTLSLVALSDFHGNLLPPGGTLAVRDPDQPETARVAAGGAAHLATLVRQLRRSNPGRTLVVAAGDMLGASPLASGLFHDEPAIEVLNAIGLDVAGVGNHEFDKGSQELLRLQRGGCFPRNADGSQGVAGVDTCLHGGRFSGARFPYLAANVIERASGQPLLAATALRTLAGVKVGFIGVTLRDTPSVVSPAGVAGLEFRDEVQTINALVPGLRRQGATVIVALVHQGGQTTARQVQDKSCPGFSGEIVDIVDRLDAAVDVVVSGHTHQEYVCNRPDGRLVTQAGPYGRMLTRIDLTLDPRTRRVIAKDANNLLVANGNLQRDAAGHPRALPRGVQALAPDPAVARIVADYAARTAGIAGQPVGSLTAPLERRTNPAGESTLGAVVADMYLAGSSDARYGAAAAQIAFSNPGGLRADLPAGDALRFGQLFSALPFNNNLVTVTLTGDQVRRLLEQQWEQPQPQGGRILSVSQGFSYQWSASAPEGAAAGQGARVMPGSMRLHGVPLEPQQRYRVTVNNFLAGGGDNFVLLREGRESQEGDIDLEVARRYLRAAGELQPPAGGRIQRVD